MDIFQEMHAYTKGSVAKTNLHACSQNYLGQPGISVRQLQFFDLVIPMGNRCFK